VSPETKAALRRAVLRRRDALHEGECALLSARIVTEILDLPAYERAAGVLAYASFGTELRPDELLRRVLAAGKALLLPRVERGGLRLYEVRDLAGDLKPGTSG
jgi:5-formyltetrahydrofolate cyclo-ligase